jgi:hypothetical protein
VIVPWPTSDDNYHRLDGVSTAFSLRSLVFSENVVFSLREPTCLPALLAVDSLSPAGRTYDVGHTKTQTSHSVVQISFNVLAARNQAFAARLGAQLSQLPLELLERMKHGTDLWPNGKGRNQVGWNGVATAIESGFWLFRCWLDCSSNRS